VRADLSRAALRAVGVIGVCDVALTGGYYWNFRRIEAGIGDSIDEFIRVQRMLSFVDLGLLVALVAGMVLLAFARPRGAGRALAITAAALATMRVVVISFLMLKPPDTEAGHTKVQALYTAMSVIGIGSIVLAMLSVTSIKKRVSLAVGIGAAALMFRVVPLFLPQDGSPSKVAFHFGSSAAHGLALAVGPLILAQLAIDEPRAAGDRVGGAPLRLLASAFAWRVAIGIIAVVLTTISLVSKNAELAGMWAGLAALISFGCTVAMIVGLVRHLRSDAPGMMPTAVVFAIVAAVIAVVVDIFATSAGIELFDIIGKAQSATSFGQFPSMKRIEELQQTVRWASRVQIGLGAAATLALAISFRATAHACKAEDAASHALDVMWLVVVAGGVAIAMSVLMERPKASEELLFVGVAALGLGIWLIASWLGLLRELAHALDVSESPARAAS